MADTIDRAKRNKRLLRKGRERVRGTKAVTRSLGGGDKAFGERR